MEKALLEPVVSKILDEMRLRPIPLGVSNRHLHLSAQDYQRLFPEQPLIEKNAAPARPVCRRTDGDLGRAERQPENVRILGPLRSQSQVEISRTDARTLGINAPLRMSGNLAGTPAIRLVSPYGEVELPHGVIVALRHIHMSPLDALIYRG